jgi:DNA-binding Xre family transcriptional regulator
LNINENKWGYAGMNFLKKLDALMAAKGLNKHKLAAQSGVKYSTICSLYDKGCDNIKLKTLKALKQYFDVSYDELADDDVKIKILDDEDSGILMKTYEESPKWKRQAILRSSMAIAEIEETLAASPLEGKKNNQ